MVGLYYQDVDYDFYSDSVRPNNRTGRRYNEGWEDAKWKSLFANITWNFLDDFNNRPFLSSTGGVTRLLDPIGGGTNAPAKFYRARIWEP